MALTHSHDKGYLESTKQTGLHKLAKLSQMNILNQANRLKYSTLILMIFSVSALADSRAGSARIMKPCCWLGNSSVPTLSPNFFSRIFTYSPPFLVPGWSLLQAQKKAGQRTDYTSFTSFPPQKFSTLSEGWTPAIARMLLQSADILNAVQAPQQYPAAKKVSDPSLLIWAESFSYFALMVDIFWACTTSKILGTSSIEPLQAGSRNSGRQTLKPRAAQVSATVLWRPLSMPNMSSKSTRALLPEPTWQTVTPPKSTFLPFGVQFTWSAGQDPGGQQA